ncbi:transposase of ISMdi26, IS5 family (plasmid) [Methylorubrum extorquens DM4]|uniref:Transposase of ISMdi26, IS5 family n=2 Tax=Methylorubrum extorquens TaxID=408 RepID=C7CN35_METED|nr:transposase of ISMdi26, IS5 family [Methylorubrum extorquens DM4]
MGVALWVMPTDRPAYPSDVSDEEWALVAPYLALLREDSAQRDYDLREVFNGLRYIVKTGAPWRFMPHDLPPWAAVYQQTQRWLSADSFADVAGDLRAVLRMAAEREPEPSAVILDSRTLRFSPESGERAGYDGAKRKRGAKVHLAVDTPGHVVALHVTPASTDDRAEVGRLAAEVQAETSDSVELAFVDQGYSGPKPAAAASAHGIALEVVKAPEAKRGFVLLPRRWVVERSFAWATRCRRLVKDYERYASTLAGLHMVAFVCFMLRQAEKLMTGA